MMPRCAIDSHTKPSISRNFHGHRDNNTQSTFLHRPNSPARLLLMSELAAKAETARSESVYNGAQPAQFDGLGRKPEPSTDQKPGQLSDQKQEADGSRGPDLLLFAVKQNSQSEAAKQAERLLPPVMINYGNSLVTSNLKPKSEKTEQPPQSQENRRPAIKWEDSPKPSQESFKAAEKPQEKAPKERLPVDGREARAYLHGDGKSLPPIARDFANLGRHMLQKQEEAEKLRPQIYVAQKGGDSRFPQGTKENPYTSIQDAVDRSAGGTVINVAPGVYKERIKVDRSDISIKTSESNPAIIEPGVGAKGRGDAGFSIGSYTSNVAIKNFEIRNFDGTKGGIRIDGRNISDITIAGNNVHSANGAEGISVYGRGKEESERVKNIDIVSNKVHNLKLGQLEAMPINGNVSEFKIIGNAGYNLDNLYIDAIGGEKTSANKDLDQPRKGLIAYNFADGISSTNNGSYKREPSAAGIYVDGAKQLEIRHNYVRGSDFGIEIASEHRGLAARQINVSGNIFENSKLAWLTRGGEANRPGGARETSVWNNTVIGNKRVQTQENVDLQTFRIFGNQAYATAETIRELPTALAVLMKKNGENANR